MSNKSYADKLIQEAYKCYYADVYRFCMSYLVKDRSSIDDCVQEAFIVLYNKYLSGDDVAYVKAFLFRTVENFALKKLRDIEKSQRTIDIDDAINIPDNTDLDDRLTFEEYSRQISAALTPREYELFHHRYISEYSLKEIGDIMDISPSAVGMRLYRLNNKLCKILEHRSE